MDSIEWVHHYLAIQNSDHLAFAQLAAQQPSQFSLE